MFSGVAVILPSLGTDLHAGASALSLIETLFLASQLAFLLPVGRLADESNKPMLYKLGLLGFGATSILIGFISSVPIILLLRILQGITSAILGATGPALLADFVPQEFRGKAYGSSLGAIYLGLTLGPICAGLINDYLNWRLVFILGGSLLIINYLFIHKQMRSSWQINMTAVNLPSTVLIILAVMSLILGSITITNSIIGIIPLLSSVGFGIWFIILQLHISKPLVDIPTLLENKIFHNALLVQMLLYTNAFCSIFMMSLFMQVTLQHSADISGRVIAAGSIMMALIAPLSGRLSDRFKPTYISSLGISFVLLTTLLATTLSEHSTLVTVGTILAIQGVGFGLFSSPNMTMIMNSIPKERTSIASALSAKSRSLGMVGGMLITTFLISLHFGNQPISQRPAEFVEIMHSVFVLLTILTSSTLVISLVGRKK
jgi:MFS family permease